jgi:hypothetical protein
VAILAVTAARMKNPRAAQDAQTRECVARRIQVFSN